MIWLSFYALHLNTIKQIESANFMGLIYQAGWHCTFDIDSSVMLACVVCSDRVCWREKNENLLIGLINGFGDAVGEKLRSRLARKFAQHIR